MSGGTIKIIDLAALTHNLAVVKKFSPYQKILAMIKADGYGHGLLEMAKGLQAADALGVALCEEGLALRKAGIQQPMVVMRGFDSAEDLAVMMKESLVPVVHRADQVQVLLNAILPKPISIWLKIDTGMHRLGFLPNEFESVYRALKASKNVASIVLMTHFSCADDEHQPEITRDQIQVFSQLTKECADEKSLANSPGLIAFPESRADWVRPGLMLYGVSPFDRDIGLQPVMTLQSKIIAIKNLNPGDAVGYGRSWVCEKPSTIGIVGIGYGDGYPRSAKNGTPILINGQRVSLVGRVSMDMIAVDVTGVKVSVGDSVILWGKRLLVAEVARFAQTIPYTLLTGVMPRVLTAIL